MPNANIRSVGSEIAKHAVTTQDLLNEARIEDFHFVEKSLGISEVRQAPVSAKPSDFGIPAGEKAIVSSGLNRSQIDAVIYCGIERDCSEPATAHIIAAALDLNPKMCFDVANACHGFSSGVQIANSFIRSGDVEYVLLVTAELTSKLTREVTDSFRSGKLNETDLSTHLGAFTVGDAGGAMILGPCEETSGIHKIQAGALSNYHNLCSYKYKDGSLSFNMDMGRISAVTLKLVKKLAGPIYKDLDWSPDDVDLFIPHQVGERPFYKTLEIVGVDVAKSIATYPKLGNLASATIPVAFDFLKQQGRTKPGQKILLGSSGSGIVVTFMGLTL